MINVIKELQEVSGSNPVYPIYPPVGIKRKANDSCHHTVSFREVIQNAIFCAVVISAF